MQTFPYLQEAYSFDVKLGQHHANAGEGTSTNVGSSLNVLRPWQICLAL
jgi:hypothetical protein